MSREESPLAEFAASLPGAWPDSPWGEDHLVYKVGPAEQGKIFVFIGDEGIGIKAGPDRDVADEWLQRYPEDASVMAYIGRSGWNDLRAGGAIADDELREAILDSYAQVVAKLPKKHRPDGWDLPRSSV